MGEKLERRQHMQPVHRIIGNMAAGKRINAGAVTTFLARKMWVTVRATFPQGADDHLFLEAFYSPDGNKYDTNTLFSTFLPVVESSSEQITQCFDCIPEVGSIKIEVYNRDNTQIEQVEVTIGVSKWDTKVSKGAGEKPEI